MDTAIIVVSPEMTTLLGPVAVDATMLPRDVCLFAFNPVRGDTPATLRVVATPVAQTVAELAEADGAILFLVSKEALKRLYDWLADDAEDSVVHLSHELHAILLHLRSRSRDGNALVAYRLAKSIELLCETVEALKMGQLVPFAGEGVLTQHDTRAIIAARGLVDRQWNEKLTLDVISRACGINRAKLTRGFRDLYGCTISEALAERRLTEAQAKLLTTDLPVSSIGYASGYLNNASFTRAFGRRYGVSPSDFRTLQRAA